MNPTAETTKYGATFTPTVSDFHSLANDYGAVFTPATSPFSTTAAPTTNPDQASVNGDTYSKKQIGILPQIADFLGMSKLGTGIGRTINNIVSGSSNDQTMADTFTSLTASDNQAIKTLHDATATPDMVSKAKLTLQTNNQLRDSAVKSFQNVGTAGLSSKQIIGSALNTGIAATLGGSLGAGGLAETGTLQSASKAAPTLLKTVGTGAAYGGLSGIGGAAQQDKSISDIAKSGALGATVGGILGGATYGLSKLVQTAGDKIMLSTIKPSRADIADGFRLDTIKQYNLGGSLSNSYDKTEAELGRLTQQLNSKLANSDATINMTDVLAQTEKNLVGNKLKTFGSNTSLAGALDQLKAELGSVSDTGQMSIPDAQLVKQASGRMGAWQYGTTDPAATAREKVYNAFYSTLKTAIENNSPPGVKEINGQLSKLIPVANAIVRRIPVAERNSALGLTDMLTLTAGILDPRALAGFGISLAQKSGAAGNLLSKAGAGAAKFAPAIGKAAGVLAGQVIGRQ